ncbi:flavin reductase family protein [Lichenifustis flavocetrariae]|uniref:Flavin reductase family protein n=1 Tax=Lichenifustis flavocetrariae TaxID=2949735 RepID=A0AA41Z8Q4_9HYPH|nr:flavin reductase family protein [Lichenifustis flavocetrariae]MCW6512385.1 flavin reductase family protein [Lichenifustis flavocetrariae]
MQFNVEKAAPRKIYDLLTGLVAPRPIAFVTSMDQSGMVDAAPYGAYNYLCSDPPILGLGIMHQSGPVYALKETALNIRNTAEFVVNVVTEDLARQIKICAMDVPKGSNKLEMARLDILPSAVVKVPRIRQAHAALECTVHTVLGIGSGDIMLGQVVSIFGEDRSLDASGPYVLATELHSIWRMNGLGAYVKTEGAFLAFPRLTYAEWKKDSAGE